MLGEIHARAIELYPHAVLTPARYQGCEAFYDDRVQMATRIAGRQKVLEGFAAGKPITADLVVHVDGAMDRRVGAAFRAHGNPAEVRFSAKYGVKLQRAVGSWIQINPGAFVGSAEIPGEFDGPLTIAPELLAKGGPFRVDLQLGQAGARIHVEALSAVLSMRSVALALLRENCGRITRREIVARLRAGAVPSFKALPRGGTRVSLTAGSGRKAEKDVFKARASVYRWLGERLTAVRTALAAQGEADATAWAASTDLQYENALRELNRSEETWQRSATFLFEVWNRVCLKGDKLSEPPKRLPACFISPKASAGKSDAFSYERAKQSATAAWENLQKATAHLAVLEATPGVTIATLRRAAPVIVEQPPPAPAVTGQLGLCFA
jgi:hypothetical protein